MYLGVDIGGTKTLVAVFDDSGTLLESTKFPTNHDYEVFTRELSTALAGLEHKNFTAAGVGMPVTHFDREHGIGLAYGNLPWKNVPVLADIERIADCPVALENDAKLAGLSEALARPDTHSVLYITISTGIGYSLVVDGQIDPNVGDAGGASLLVPHKGTLQPWESFASGRAIVARFGKRAEDIHDQTTWKRIVHDWRVGMLELLAVCEPTTVVIGGSVGTYFDRYKDALAAELQRYETPLLSIPPFQQAHRPEEAVVYGCFAYAKQQFGAVHA